MLKIEKLSVSFGDTKVIEDLSFTFADGKTTAIVGASGVGKTTLIRALAGLYRATTGKIESSYVKPSYVFQESRLFPWLTALENVSLVCDDIERSKAILHRLIPDKSVDGKNSNGSAIPFIIPNIARPLPPRA